MHILILLATSLSALMIGSHVIKCEPRPWADHVCNTTVPRRKDIIVEIPKEYEIPVESMCGLLPCVKKRTEIRMDQSIKSILQSVEVSACCPGYTETPDRRCAPICLQSCNNGGRCVAPNTCKCLAEPSQSSPGFVGHTCSRFVCLNDKWGSKCDRPCDCSGNSYCSADTGKCLCFPGWRGINCTLECDPTSDSDECSETNRLPSILEPEANLIDEKLVMPRQKPEALVFDDEVKITAEYNGRDWRTYTSSYLVAMLSIMCLIFIFAFFVVKRRYDRVLNEIYYSTGTSNYSPDSRDGSASYYSTGQQPSGGNLGKNMSFETATRQFFLGKSSNAMPEKHEEARKTMIFHPRVESHLINSQKESRANLYSEVALDVSQSNNQVRPASALNHSASEEHIYQVPRLVTSSAGVQANLSHLSTGNLDDVSIELDNSTSNIYEEIKPRI